MLHLDRLRRGSLVLSALLLSCSVGTRIDLYNDSEATVTVVLQRDAVVIEPNTSGRFWLHSLVRFEFDGHALGYAVETRQLLTDDYRRCVWKMCFRLQFEPTGEIFAVPNDREFPIDVSAAAQPEGFPLRPVESPASVPADRDEG